MLFFPVKRYEIKSLARPSEIATALGPHVQPLPIVTRLGGHKTFAGSVSETGFRFIRVRKHRNSFRPTVSGILSSDSEITTIHVTIKHDVYFLIPVIIIFLLFAAFSLPNSLFPLVVALFSNNSQDMQKYLSYPYLSILLSPVAVLFIGYFFAVISFAGEANAAQKELADILDQVIIKTEIHS